MKMELSNGMIITGRVELQYTDKEDIDNRVIIRNEKGNLIQAFAKSLVEERITRTTCNEIAKIIKSVIRIEYKSKNKYKEITLRSLTTEVSRAISDQKKEKQQKNRTTKSR